MLVGTSLFAAGHGEVTYGDCVPGGYGCSVDIDHGSETSKYAHLDSPFLSPGMRVCRHVAVGYSGDTGNSDGPHLHFGGEISPNQFAPIHGNRPGRVYNSQFQYDPYHVPPTPRPSVAHSGVQTNAYTVDDIQTSEFFLHGSVGYLGWTDAPFGFSYFDEANANMWYVGVEEETTHWATWDPILPIVSDWAVYVFIPWRDATARNAHYQVLWWDGMSWQSDTAFVDQYVYANQWVRLEGFLYSTFPTTAPGQWHLSVRVYNDCPYEDCSEDEKLGVDAALFIPADCGP
jgi:hypothetical protein